MTGYCKIIFNLKSVFPSLCVCLYLSASLSLFISNIIHVHLVEFVLLSECLVKQLKMYTKRNNFQLEYKSFLEDRKPMDA